VVAEHDEPIVAHDGLEALRAEIETDDEPHARMLLRLGELLRARRRGQLAIAR
jgi:hypothetical protein